MEDSTDRREPFVPSDNTTLLAVLASYRDAGFGGDFWTTDAGQLRCGTCRSETPPGDVDLHAVRRLEGASDPADMLAVLALRCASCDNRGTAVVSYGPQASEAEVQILRGVEDRRTS